MIYYGDGSIDASFSRDDVRAALHAVLDQLGERKRILTIPPDFTRFHSQAGLLTEMAWEYYGGRLADVLPAIGTHLPMTDAEIDTMFGRTPKELFRTHDWRGGCVTLGEIPAQFVREVSERKIDYAIPVVIDRLLAEGGHDLILSIGQIVPHEVIGMAGYNKNIFVGTGGGEGINKTHFLGAVYGMERMMGRADTPVRRVLNYASERFTSHLPIIYVLTVVGPAGNRSAGDGALAIRGLFIGDDHECFHQAAALARQVNFQLLDAPIRKAVVWLDPGEFKSTWLGNKSIYRTRMALADGGELVVLAPGVSRFGEDGGIDGLIRRYGYVGTDRILELVRESEDLRDSLGTAAHLIHGSTEGRFAVTYCPEKLSRREIEGAGYQYGDLAAMTTRYDPEKLSDGYNTLADGEEIFFVSNP
ncbi:MAG: lactate racemase domain-containing protein, partial [Acidobacteriota bacterium]|nr:lactate racemase domain-containing protein [Acidobacteriota bacterium]